MTPLQTLGTQLASVPNRVIAALPDRASYLPSSRSRRRWGGSEAIAAFALGLAIGAAIGVLLGASDSQDEEEEPATEG